MNPQPFVIKPADRKTALNVLATQVTVLTAGGDSSDQRITLQAGAEGTGPPPHSHDWDESFYVGGADSVHVWRRKFDVRRGHVRPHSGLYCALIQLRAGRRRID